MGALSLPDSDNEFVWQWLGLTYTNCHGVLMLGSSGGMLCDSPGFPGCQPTMTLTFPYQ